MKCRSCKGKRLSGSCILSNRSGLIKMVRFIITLKMNTQVPLKEKPTPQSTKVCQILVPYKSVKINLIFVKIGS